MTSMSRTPTYSESLVQHRFSYRGKFLRQEKRTPLYRDNSHFLHGGFLSHQAKIMRNLRQEDGNIESSLVLIPLLILFLIGVQLIVSINLRNSDLALAQGDAAARAISHEFKQGDQVLEVGGRIEKIRLLVTHRSHSLPQIVPGLIALMGGTPVTDVVGVAVVEPINE